MYYAPTLANERAGFLAEQLLRHVPGRWRSCRFQLAEIADEAHVLYRGFWQFRVVFQAVGRLAPAGQGFVFGRYALVTSASAGISLSGEPLYL